MWVTTVASVRRKRTFRIRIRDEGKRDAMCCVGCPPEAMAMAVMAAIGNGLSGTVHIIIQ